MVKSQLLFKTQGWKLALFCIFFLSVHGEENSTETSPSSLTVGSCLLIISKTCPDSGVQFFLFTRKNPINRQWIHIDDTLQKSNLSQSYFDHKLPTKIIIHGYNSDMFLGPLVDMRTEYLLRDRYNIFAVDWSALSQAPCYPTAVHNTQHTGKCVAQLIDRLRDSGVEDIHVIGFSLGAHVPNFAAVKLRPYKIPRITGLDPAMPLFITAPADGKLDESDAEFVDVIHTNALVQGKIESCGHVDFYMNGGVSQPGCWSGGENPFACSHHRAPDYFSESIRSQKGFWGWPCRSYFYYILGLCPPTNYQILAGEDCKKGSRGFHLVTTNSDEPFALGKWTDLSQPSTIIPESVLKQYIGVHYNSVQFTTNSYWPNQYYDNNNNNINMDDWGKLTSPFNHRSQDESYTTPYSQDPYSPSNWPYFNQLGAHMIYANSNKRIHHRIKRKLNNKRKTAVERKNLIKYRNEVLQTGDLGVDGVLLQADVELK